ncbi:uncharacterized protein [Dysidea avara]|uniref:uncharacterized protein isoform X2 n=1 Tax=Dysidea avara TaxID=196820 RepID=UPI00332B5086
MFTVEAISCLLQWTKGGHNQALVQILGKVAELNWMWEKTIEKFVEQYSSYQHYLKMLFKAEKEIDEHNKELMTCYSKMTKAKKQFEASRKKGDAAHIMTREDEMKTMTSQYTSMQEKVADSVRKLEHTKVTSMKAALKEQANAYVNMAGKCQTIFTAQRAVAAIIPDESTLLSNQHVCFENISKLVDSVSEKLGLVPQHNGGSDTAIPIPARSRGVTISIAGSNRNDLPVPLRSPHSLKVSESPYEPMYVTPNRKRFATMKPTINTVTTQTIQKKAAESYESKRDWFQSQKDMPDSKDQENLYESLGSYKRKDSSHYEETEFEQKLSFTQSFQIQTRNPQSDYITILADTQRADYTSGMTRSHSDSHLHYTGENDYIQMSGVSNSLQLPVSGHSHHASLPNIPENQTDSLPPVDASSPGGSSSPNTLAPTYQKIYSEELQTDEERVIDSNYEHNQFVKQVDTSSAVNLCVTDKTALQHKLQLSRSCEDISGITSNGLKKQAPSTSSLGIPSDSHLSMKSHSVGQVNMLAALNKEVYSFITNSLHPERKEKSQPSLSEIFGKYCQNKDTMPDVTLKGDNRRHSLSGKAAFLDDKVLSSECSSLCSSVELLSNNSSTIQQKNVRTLKGSSIKMMEE